MAEQKFFTPLKVGLLIVIISYFLFTLHAMFTLSWLGEWDRLGGGAFGTMILVEDISATIGLIFRFAASIVALAAITVYFSKKTIQKSTAYKVLRLVLVFEGIYWLGLSATAGYSLQSFGLTLLHYRSIGTLLNSLLLSAIPTVVEAFVLPIALFVFAFKLNPNKPLKKPIKWGLITGTIYIIVFWQINTSIWVGVVWGGGVNQKGTAYLTANPENLLSFILTVFGLLSLVIYSSYFTKKSSGAESLQELKVRSIGGIVLALGMYFLWNYLSWVILADDKWNNWYAWFLGHNMDLWMLSLPLVALPLLFHKSPKQLSKTQ
jgi:uncharacterized protein YjeT (DUF2065 family)